MRIDKAIQPCEVYDINLSLFFQNVELILKNTVSFTPRIKMQRIAGCDLDHKDRRSADI